MNRLFITTISLGLLTAACGTSGTHGDSDYTTYVDPFIGTGGHGHTFPGPVVPHAMIQPGPDTESTDGMPVPATTIATH